MQSQRRGKKRVRVAPGFKQLEATVHTSVPPHVQGALHAYVKICVSAIVWEYSIGPPASKLCVGLKWWGEESPGTIFRVPVILNEKKRQQSTEESTTLAFFPVRTSLPQLKAYLKDMKALKLLVGLGHMTEDSMVIGRCTIPDLSGLNETSPYEDSLPITSPQGHMLGMLHIQIEIQVARAGQTSLATSTAVDDTVEGPVFTVGPGVPLKAKRREFQEIYTEEKLQSKETNKQSNLTGQNEQTSTSSASSHKAALLAKYTDRYIERSKPTSGSGQNTQGGLSQSDLTHNSALPLGPQQLQIIAELIERGERLRDAMVVSVLKSGGRQEGEEEEGREEGKMEGVNVDHDVFSSEEEDDRMGDGDISMTESDYPLHNTSLLEQLLYSNNNDEQETMRRFNKVDSAVQTMSDDIPPPTSQTHIPATLTAKTSTSCTKVNPLPSNSPPSSCTQLTQGDSASNQTESQRDGDSTTDLTSFFSGQSLQKSLDTEILQTIGMDRLTLLGRITSCRVLIETLVVDPGLLASSIATHSERTKPHHYTNPTTKGTFFVEYHFPASMATRGRRQRGRGGKGSAGKGGGRSFPPPHEVVRVASKKIINGVIHFGHRSVFPVSLVGHMTRQWWHDVLIFSVFYRPPTNRVPFLLGKARVPFRQWLVTGSPSHIEATITTSVLNNRGKEGGGQGCSSVEKTLGKLTVCVQLLCGKGDGQKVLSEKASLPTPGVGGDKDRERERGGETCEEKDRKKKWINAPPIKVRETQTASATEIDKQPSALQLLLMIPEAIDLHLPTTNITTTAAPTSTNAPATTTDPVTSPPSSHQTRELAPNCYLVCRLFCASPHPKTTTVWASSNPQFNFKQVFPLYLTPSLLEQVCNNFTVVEVWHKTPGTNTDDELLGLVKLSLHQFYLAFSEPTSADLCLHAQLPVVAVDSYCPVISLFTGNEQGHLAVLLAMGSIQQVTVLQQQFAGGSYVLQKPFRKSQSSSRSFAPVNNRPQIGRPEGETDEDNSGCIHHTFDVRVSGVRGLSVFNNTVWGEADCFVQYHFPSITNNHPLREDSDGTEEDYRERGTAGNDEASLQSYRTDMTLCVPNPIFDHETRHSFSLPPAHLIQRVVMTTCGGNGGVPFELWRRFYYPNIRDQLIAKASLPVAKLCALVSMQRMCGPTIQSFSLPMKLVTTQETQGGSGGILEVTVQYQALQENHHPLVVTDTHKKKNKTHTILTVEVIRATGLKDAALLAAQVQPVPLGFAAEVGTNSYARITVPELLANEKRQTKTVMRSFSPEFSHSFDIALPLILRESVHPYTVTIPLAQRLTECNVVIEIWHKIPKNDLRCPPASIHGVVFGHRLVPAFRDVCLGCAVVPLVTLLEKQNGISGWIPLYPLVSSSHAAPELTSNYHNSHSMPCYVGGVEVSLSLSNQEDRQLILSQGKDMGWKLPEGHHLNCLDELKEDRIGGEGRVDGGLLGSSKSRLRFSVKVTDLWVPMETVTIAMSEDPAPYMYCYLKYKFFDSNVVFSVPKALSYSREGRGCYQLNHHATVTITGSHELDWYIREQCMEIEVWSCPNRRREQRERSDDQHSDESESESNLIGTAFIWLNDLYLEDCNTISGSYPMFKAGEVSLGNRTVMVMLEKSLVESQGTDDCNTVLKIHDPSDNDGGSDFVPLKPVSESQSVEGKKDNVGDEEKEDNGDRFVDMFEAHLVIHQALHLPMMTNKTQESEWPPNAYVTLHPHPKVDKIVTDVVDESQTPNWNHQCITHIPNLYLDPHCPGLELQVWSKVHGSSSVPSRGGDQTEDICIGCVHVDLSTLPLGLSQITGWYNITDFGGDIQGQIKVSIVPSQGLNLQSQSSSVLFPNTNHVMSSAQSMMSSHLSALLHSSSRDYVQPAPSFMEKSSSVLFRKLRDDLKELDQINSSLKANTPHLSEVSDLKSLCIQLHTTVPHIPISPQHSVATTQSSLQLNYSLSGEHHVHKTVHKTDVHPGSLKEAETPSTLVHEHILQPEVVTSISSTTAPENHQVMSQENESGKYSSNNLSTPTHDHHNIFLDQPTHSHAATNEDNIHGNDDDDTVTAPCSDANSLHVQVGDNTCVESRNSSETESNATSSYSESLTDISTCSSNDRSPLTEHSPANITIEQQSDALEGGETTTIIPSSNQLILGREDVGSSCEGGVGSNNERCVVEQAIPSTIPQTVDLHTSNNDVIMTGTPPSDSETHNRPDTQDDTQFQNHPSHPPASPSDILEQSPDQPPSIQKPSVHLPEISLPNFFMPLHELERTMRSLRASVLVRPPPATLFETEEEKGRRGHRHISHHHHQHHNMCPDHCHLPSRGNNHILLEHNTPATTGDTQRSSSVKTFRDVDQLLRCRRARDTETLTAATTTVANDKQQHTLSSETTQRLSRIFTSQPLATHQQ